MLSESGTTGHVPLFLNGREFTMSATFAFQWHITEACDQRCKHCYIVAENACKQLKSQTFEQMQITLDNIEDFCAHFHRSPYLYITGGDPILHPDFWKLMDLLKKKQIPFTIMGNPFHLNDEVCRRLHESGCIRYQMSIDGMRETHDWFRKPGSFDKTLTKIPVLKRNGIRAIIMTTASSRNIAEIPDIIDTVVEHKADVFAFARYVPTSEEKSTGISPMEYRNLLEKCDRKFKAYEASGCSTYFNRKDYLWTLYQYETGEFKIPENAKKGMIYGGCNCAGCHMTILSTGEVYACRRVKNSCLGSVYTDKLSDLFLHQDEAYRRFGEFKKCSRCRLLAWCRGCPAVAAGTYGSFYDEDPQCWADVEGSMSAV